MIISNKILGLKIKYSTVSETEMIIKQLCNFNTWTSAIIEYGLRSILFYPTDTTVALSFLDEERIWCFRHDRHFCIMVMFENEEDLVLFKLQCLLDT